MNAFALRSSTFRFAVRTLVVAALALTGACGGSDGSDDRQTDQRDSERDPLDQTNDRNNDNNDPAPNNNNNNNDPAPTPEPEMNNTPSDIGKTCQYSNECSTGVCLIRGDVTFGYCSIECEDFTNCPTFWSCDDISN